MICPHLGCPVRWTYSKSVLKESARETSADMGTRTYYNPNAFGGKKQLHFRPGDDIIYLECSGSYRMASRLIGQTPPRLSSSGESARRRSHLERRELSELVQPRSVNTNGRHEPDSLPKRCCQPWLDSRELLCSRLQGLHLKRGGWRSYEGHAPEKVT